MNQDKVNAVAYFVAQDASNGFRGRLFGFAQAGLDVRIERALERESDLNAYLDQQGFPALEPDELRYCSDWGICAAKSVRHLPDKQGDAEIARRLKNYFNCDGTNPGGGRVDPIGA